MKYIQEKDKKKRLNVKNNENIHNSIKFLDRFDSRFLEKGKIGQNLSNTINFIVKKARVFYKNNFSKISVKNRCIFTNRSKSIYKFGRISRIKLRSYSSSGYMTGITKSSW